jgi:pyrimidine operon attenuation protein/uracil phosphoribosyltransferase
MKRSRTKKNRILDAGQIHSILERFARDMLRHYARLDQVVFIGVRTRGPYVARRLAGILKKRIGREIPVGEMDITLYRDDLNTLLPGGNIDHTRIPFDIGNKIIVLFDDVLNTGRSVRAAVDHLIDLGRPRMIHLAVLIDRGGRELPIAANYVGKKIRLSAEQEVQVKLKEIDRVDEVVIGRRNGGFESTPKSLYGAA